MSKTPGRCFIIFSALYLLSSPYLEAAQERYIYDAMGSRDPFIPLVDQRSSTGLRETFQPPEEKVKLPLEIAVKGILSSGKEYYAIINDEVMKKGQKIGEIEIKDIETNRVVLGYQQKEFVVFFKKEEEK